jgi:uncharacterized protein (DUF1800 family)
MARLALLDSARDRIWDRETAAHLARRAGFGATPAELDQLVELGLEAAVDSFVDWPERETELEREEARFGSALADLDGMQDSTQAAVARLRLQWLWRMVASAYPLREKLTLCWHDHFATAESKVLRIDMLQAQYETLHRLCGAQFRELLGAVARDPAMLVYLDNRVSKKKHPNENFARELLELFTLGVNQYGQRDVAEIARVFTGWTTPDRNRGPFEFDSADHDSNDKLVLGQVIPGRRGAAGEREGDEVLELLAGRAECANFIAAKLCAWFVAHEPPEELVAAVAKEFVLQQGSIRETLRALFRSQAFYNPALRFQLHKTPVEWAVGAARLVGVRNVHLLGLDQRLSRMGMRLFEPPSVAGWESGRAWAQSSQLSERFELALIYSTLAHSSRAVFGAAAADYDALRESAELDSAALVDQLCAHLLQRAPQAAARAVLIAHLDDALPFAGAAKARAPRQRERVRALVHLVLCTPEFQLA